MPDRGSLDIYGDACWERRDIVGGLFFGKGESNRGGSIITIKTKKACQEAVDVLPLIFPARDLLFCLFEPKYPSSVK